MKLARTDADFGTKSVAEAIGESRRSIVHYAGSVHLSEKALCSFSIVGNDAFGVR